MGPGFLSTIRTIHGVLFIEILNLQELKSVLYSEVFILDSNLLSNLGVFVINIILDLVI